MDRTAFARARGFLDYTPTPKWTATLCSLATTVIYILLILILALFADLLISQGRIPAFSDLSPDQRASYLATWTDFSQESRDAIIAPLELNDSSLAKRLSEAEPEPALDGPEHELRWHAFVRDRLDQRVGSEAAELYLPSATPGQSSAERQQQLLAQVLPWSSGSDKREYFGMLSPVVRFNFDWTGPVLGWIASWNSWAWNPPTGKDANRGYLTGLLILALVLTMLRSILMIVTNYAAAESSLDAITRLRRLIYHHTYRLGTLAIRKLGPSEAVGIFTRHAETVHHALNVWLTSAYRYPLQFAVLVVIALALQFWLAVTIILAALMVWFLGGQLALALRRGSYAAVRQASTRLALLQESMMMMRLVKCYLMELFNQNRVERQLNEYADANLRRFRSEANARAFMILVASLTLVAMMYIAGLIVLTEGTRITNLVLLAVVLVSMYFPVRGWLDSRRVIRRGREAATVIFEFLDRRGEVGQVVDAEFLEPMRQAIQFRGVSLREPGTGRMLLKDVHLTIRAGEKVCLVGAEEAEKHALVYLVPRFLDPTSGEIRIDGKNIRYVTRDSLRSQMAVVLQHNLIFNDTIGNNISCGDPSYTLPQIIEAAKTAHAHQFIQKLPAGYQTTIGDLGHSLRFGEQFRIALARAILRDPALLILEEPVQPLDENTKDLIDDTLARILPGRTVIFLPHRVSTIRKSDRIVLINEGQVEAEGEHRDLVTTHGLYKHLLYLEFNDYATQA